MKIIEFDGDGVDREVDAIPDLTAIPEHCNVWILVHRGEKTGVAMVDELADLRDSSRFELHVGADSYSLSIPAAPGRNGAGNDTLALLVGRNWLVSYSDGDLAICEEFLARDTGETLRGKLTASAIAASLLLLNLAEYEEIIGSIDREVDGLDDAILRSRARSQSLSVLAVLRRRSARLRSGLADQRRVIEALNRPDFSPEITDADEATMRQLAASYERTVDQVNRTREAILGSFDLYATMVGQETNTLLKALTIVTVVTGLIGAVAGVFGMNFETPFFKTGEQGFMLVTTTMVTFAMTALIVSFFLQRRR